MSARIIWYPSESLVTEVPAAQPTVSEAGSDGGSKNGIEASSSGGAGSTLAKSKPKIIRRRIPTVDTSNIRNDCTDSNEKLDANQCGRGITHTTYSTIENSGAHACTQTLVSNLMQYDESVSSKDTDFHGWLHNDPILQWRNIFLPKLEHPTNKSVKENHRTRRHRSEEYIFQHYKDTSEYMNYYRKHCCLTSLSVPSLKKQHQKSKPKENSKQDKKSTRPATRGVFHTIDDGGAGQKDNLTDKQAANNHPHNPKLAELENRLNLTASVVFPSKPLPLVPKPTPPSIVNRESTSIILCGSGSSSCEKYYKDDGDPIPTKEAAVKSSRSTAEGVELPPINNCNHASSDSSISLANYLHIKQHRRMLFSDPLVGAEGELEDHPFHNELEDISDPTLAASSVSVIQKSKSSGKLDIEQHKDENISSSMDESWMYPYPHFQVPSSSRYDKMTREQLLSSKAHALGLLSSKNWIKSKKSGTAGNGDITVPTRIKSSPGRIPKELSGNSNFAPTLESVSENLHVSNSKKSKHMSSKATVTDTIHNRLKTAGPNTSGPGHVRSASQSRPIHTSQGNKPQHQRGTSSTRHSQPQGRKQSVTPSVVPTGKASHLKRQLATSIHHNQQLSSYIGQVNERLQGILKVKHDNSTFIQDSVVAS